MSFIASDNVCASLEAFETSATAVMELSTKRVILTFDQLPDDVVLEIFDTYKDLVFQDSRVLGMKTWNSKRGWYTLAHVTRRWRSIALASSFRLRLMLHLSHGAPAKEMLRHLHFLPIVVNYASAGTMSGNDEDDILTALQLPERIHAIRIEFPEKSRQEILAALSKPFTALESFELNFTGRPNVPGALLGGFAPRLASLTLRGAVPAQLPRFLDPLTNLLSLRLERIHAHPSLTPDTFLGLLRAVPRLERLIFSFLPSSDIPTPTLTTPAHSGDLHSTLPKLTTFHYRGRPEYLEGVVDDAEAPLLRDLQLTLFGEFSTDLTVPRLCQFITESELLRYPVATIFFTASSFGLWVGPRPYSSAQAPLSLELAERGIEKQMSLMAQLCHALSSTLDSVEELTFVYWQDDLQHEWRSAATPPWHELLKHFRSVRTLRVESGVLFDLARFLAPRGDGACADVLPVLEEIELQFEEGYVQLGEAFDALEPFAAARQSAARPVETFCKMLSAEEWGRVHWFF
ncbi:hypothetical protein BC834DRAFT_966815 [Gloeopeniophorella convolvens]|nr:hypothetical protein BC834DRAFT_966815 [Gloeopeniophorella convolvens]